MSTPFSPRQSGPHHSESGAQQRPAAATDTMPDPWGVRRAENLLTSLEGIISARVVTTPLGEVSEIHILAQAGLTPKQIVRNVESALLAQLGLKVDHRKISIAPGPIFSPQRSFQNCIRLNYGLNWTPRVEAAIASVGALASGLAERAPRWGVS